MFDILYLNILMYQIIHVLANLQIIYIYAYKMCADIQEVYTYLNSLGN